MENTPEKYAYMKMGREVFGDGLVCLRHLSVFPQEKRLRILCDVAYERGLSVSEVQDLAKCAKLFDSRSENYAGVAAGEKWIDSYYHGNASNNCKKYIKDYFIQPIVISMCKSCDFNSNPERTFAFENVLRAIYLRSDLVEPEMLPSLGDKIRMLQEKTFFSCVFDNKAFAVYFELYAALFDDFENSGINLPLDEAADENRLFDVLASGKYLAGYFKRNPEEVKDLITFEIRSFIKALFESPLSPADVKRALEWFALPRESAGIRRKAVDHRDEQLSLFDDSTTARSEFEPKTEKEQKLVHPACPPENCKDAETDNGSESGSGAAFGNDNVEPEQTTCPDLGIAAFDDEQGLILKNSEAEKIRIVDRDGFLAYCDSTLLRSDNVALEVVTVNNKKGVLLLSESNGAVIDRIIFADADFLNKGFWLRVLLHLGIPVITCNLALLMSLARESGVFFPHNAQSLGALTASKNRFEKTEVYPFGSLIEGACPSSFVKDIFGRYIEIWKRESLIFLRQKGQYKRYRNHIDYENVLASSYELWQVMYTTLYNLVRDCYHAPAFRYNQNSKLYQKVGGVIVRYQIAPPVEDAGRGNRTGYYVMLLHYLQAQSIFKHIGWSLLSVDPSGITLFIRSKRRENIEAVRDAIAAAYVSTSKIAEFQITPIKAKFSVLSP